MKFAFYFYKAKARVWNLLVYKSYHTPIFLFIYRSYWHFLFSKKKQYIPSENMYYSARPNPGAGIGHQLANWIAGYWFARQFGLKFAHSPFSTKKWDDFLGFGEEEISVDELEKKRGYKKVLLPLFDEDNQIDILLIKRIIASYYNQKVIFIAEQDQGYRDQFGVMEDLKRKFYNAHARVNDKLIYSSDSFNIAIHVRRGDITVGQINKNPNLLMRWQDNDYFKNVLSLVVENLPIQKPISIYLFSQGEKDDFLEFKEFKNLFFCLDMNPQDSFLHMVNADLLITSKSSFSYKPALLNNGIKICPRNFWHSYPNVKDWILAEENGEFSTQALK